MPRKPEEIRRRLDELLQRCDSFLPPCEPDDTDGPRSPRRFSAPKAEMWRFLISSIQTVGSACGEGSPHLRELQRCRERFIIEDGPGLDMDTCRGALLAARDDLDAGMLLDIRQLVTAEAFGDLLESAVHLLDENHHIPAVAVAGAVLESSIRALAHARGVSWQGTSGISKLNKALYAAKVYDKVVFGELEAWGKLRNFVDHGNFTHPADVDADAARRMVEGIRSFVLKYR